MDSQTVDQLYNFTILARSMAGNLGRQEFVLQVNKCRFNSLRNIKNQQKVVDLNSTATVSIDPKFTVDNCSDLIYAQRAIIYDVSTGKEVNETDFIEMESKFVENNPIEIKIKPQSNESSYRLFI